MCKNSAETCIRCSWVNPANPEYIRYHDEEWGVPVHDDGKLFEMLVLESFQAGLSWECILNKREAFRKAFSGFDPREVAAFSPEKMVELQQDPGIVRNRRKISSAVKNARIFLEIQKEFGSFDGYLRSITGNKVYFETGKTHSELSDRLSADLYQRGMKFVGTVIIYSFLQAIGVINSHECQCYLHNRQ